VDDTALDKNCCKRTKDYENYKKKQGQSDPRKLFSNALDCVASDICRSLGPKGRQFDDPSWMLCINKELYDRWKAHNSGCWKTAENACEAAKTEETVIIFGKPITIKLPSSAQQLACFGAMAACHDGLDMIESLKSCGCGTDNDWDKTGDIVGDCSHKFLTKR
jgi:hypothetical protein